LQKEILKKKIGQPVTLTVWRSGGTMKIAVPTAELPSELTKVANPPVKSTAEPKLEALGLKLRDAKPAGAQIANILPDSPASKAEILAEDIITEVDTKPVADAAACAAAITAGIQAKGTKGVILNVDRQGKRTYVVLRPQKPSS
jgi:S1-C subfamily serine protease